MADLADKLKAGTTLAPATPAATGVKPSAEKDSTEVKTEVIQNSDLDQTGDVNIRTTIPEGNQNVDTDNLDPETSAALDDIFSAPMPANPKAVEFGAKEIEVGGRKLRLPSTQVNDSDFGSYTDEGFLQPIAAFKHHAVKRFQVGKHTFQNHILQLFNEADLVDFLQCWEGLQGPDKVNITQYDWEAAARVNRPVSDLIARGSQSTKNIKDPKQVA